MPRQQNPIYIDKRRNKLVGKFYGLKNGKTVPRRDLCDLVYYEYKQTKRGKVARSDKEKKTLEKELYSKAYKQLLEEQNQEKLEEPLKTPLVSILMQQYIDSLVDHAEHTQKTYAHSLTLYLKAVKDHRINEFQREYKDQLIRYLQSLPIESSTARTHVVQIQRFFNWCLEEDLIDRPIRLKKPKVLKKNPTSFTKEQLQEFEIYLNQLIGRNDHRKPFYLNHLRIFRMVTQTGMRAGEIWGLPIEHIDLNQRWIYIEANHGWVPKKGVEGRVKMSPKLFEFLMKDLETRQPKEKFYLDDGFGNRVYAEVGNMSQAFARHWVKLGYRHADPIHGIRSTIGTLIGLELGILYARKWLRHQSINTTVDHYFDDSELDNDRIFAVL